MKKKKKKEAHNTHAPTSNQKKCEENPKKVKIEKKMCVCVIRNTNLFCRGMYQHWNHKP